MIIGFLLEILIALLKLVTGVLPVANLPAQVAGAFQYIIDSLYKFSDIIPVTGILLVLSTALAFEVLVFTYKSYVWIYNKLRGSTGSR